MLKLYFDGVFSILTILLVIGLMVLVIYAFKRNAKIQKWGRLIALFIIVGTAISALSATRDGYATSEALFAMDSWQSNVCSIAGGAIFLTGLISVFLKKQRRVCFYLVAALFVVQVAVVEGSRIFMM